MVEIFDEVLTEAGAIDHLRSSLLKNLCLPNFLMKASERKKKPQLPLNASFLNFQTDYPFYLRKTFWVTEIEEIKTSLRSAINSYQAGQKFKNSGRKHAVPLR